jgi:hypothetical protein
MKSQSAIIGLALGVAMARPGCAKALAARGRLA